MTIKWLDKWKNESCKILLWVLGIFSWYYTCKLKETIQLGSFFSGIYWEWEFIYWKFIKNMGEVLPPERFNGFLKYVLLVVGICFLNFLSFWLDNCWILVRFIVRYIVSSLLLIWFNLYIDNQKLYLSIKLVLYIVMWMLLI